VTPGGELGDVEAGRRPLGGEDDREVGHAAVRWTRLHGKVSLLDADVADFAVRPRRQGAGRAGLYIAELAVPASPREPPHRGSDASHARIAFEGAAAAPLGAAGQGWPLVSAGSTARR